MYTLILRVGSGIVEEENQLVYIKMKLYLLFPITSPFQYLFVQEKFKTDHVVNGYHGLLFVS